MRTRKQIISDTFDELVIIRQLVREGRRGWRINDISKSHGRIKACDIKGIVTKSDADLQVMAFQIYDRNLAYMTAYNNDKRPMLLSEMAKPSEQDIDTVFKEKRPAPAPKLETATVRPSGPTLFTGVDEFNVRLDRMTEDFCQMVRLYKEANRKLDLILQKI